MPEGSQCRLYLLRHEGSTIASLIAFWHGRSALYYQAGWDPDSPLAALSPGAVLMARSIRDAVEHGLAYYEFLRGDEAYKSRWTKQFRTTSTVLLASRWIGRFYLGVAHGKDRAKPFLGQNAARPLNMNGRDRAPSANGRECAAEEQTNPAIPHASLQD
jgi:CelD/BcsL family acetyltransferase involved in cellulose biosynthesis